LRLEITTNPWPSMWEIQLLSIARAMCKHTTATYCAHLLSENSSQNLILWGKILLVLILILVLSRLLWIALRNQTQISESTYIFYNIKFFTNHNTIKENDGCYLCFWKLDGEWQHGIYNQSDSSVINYTPTIGYKSTSTLQWALRNPVLEIPYWW
jgi:hypothetical protein